MTWQRESGVSVLPGPMTIVIDVHGGAARARLLQATAAAPAVLPAPNNITGAGRGEAQSGLSINFCRAQTDARTRERRTPINIHLTKRECGERHGQGRTQPVTQ